LFCVCSDATKQNKFMKDLKHEYQNGNSAGFETRRAVKSLIVAAALIPCYLLGKHIQKVYRSSDVSSVPINQGNKMKLTGRVR
jgi:hypothetical protein